MKEEFQMNPIICADRMKKVHSDIRGPIFQEANRMSAEGISILKLNTGNPATFGFKCQIPSVRPWWRMRTRRLPTVI